MKRLRIFIATMCFLACLAAGALGNVTTFAAPAAGKPETQRLRWKGKTVKIALSTSLTRFSSNIKSDSDVLGAVRRSLEAWANASGIDLEFEASERQSVSPDGRAGDGISLITIAQTSENVQFFAKDADSASAKTRIFYTGRGIITEADIVLNPFQQFSTDGTFGTFDLESTLTHEIGHLLGLSHLGVLGATMSESFAKNGSMGIADLSPRTLSESDIAKIRELYGSPDGVEVCCGAIAGKVTTENGRPGKGFQIWAEESHTGRVMAETESGADGGYRLGGLPSGDYSVYWKTSHGSMGEFGSVQLEIGEVKALSEKVALRPADANVQFLGQNGQLADHGIQLIAGRSATLNIGGHNLDHGRVQIAFSSPHIKVVQLPLMTQEFGGGVTAVNFLIVVDPAIEAGNYSVFVNGKDGTVSCLVGALSIEPTPE